MINSKNILIVDNFDSFTNNLYHLLSLCRPKYSYTILRNRNKQILTEKWDTVIISPGPGHPCETGLLTKLFNDYIIPKKIPVLGVCLGMQFIAHYYNIPVVRSTNPSHGRPVTITVKASENTKNLFHKIPTEFSGIRYNSLSIGKDPSAGEDISPLQVLATETDSGEIMAIKHKDLPFVGVQFHPESFLTEYANQMIENFFTQYVETLSLTEISPQKESTVIGINDVG